MSFLFSLTLGIAITALALATSQFLSADYLKAPELTKPLLIGSVILLLSILNSSENGTLAGLEDFKSIAINTLIGSFFEAACMVVGAYFYQLEGAVAGFAIGVLCLYIANKLSAIRALNKAGISAYVKSVYKEDWALIFSYSIPATLSALTVTPVFWLVRSMLVRASNYGELGIFEAADQWKVMLLFVPGAICQIVLPIMSSITDHRLFRKALIGNLALIGGIAAILALVSWFVAPILMPLYGRTFTDTATLTALAFSTIPTALAQILEMTLYSREKMWTSFGFNIVWGISTVALAYLFLENQQGAFGIAMAILLAYILKLLCMGSYLSIITKGGKQ
jgi:O-antigen/teichoic acid export membrane protein